MYCNQPFCDSGFSNGQYCNYDQTQQSMGLVPAIIGEGEVTSITLPNGTCQYFFKPTVKWWTPTSNSFPPQYNTINTNYTNPYYTNTGVWFIRSISNSNPQFTNNFYMRQETPRFSFSSDYNMDRANPGYQLKFHNDGVTSTTDIHYFYPYLRQYDCTFNFPAKGCAGVQVNTPVVNSCHYDIVCSKPCNCKPITNRLLQSPSIMSIDTKDKSDTNSCACYSKENPVKKHPDCIDVQQRQIISHDERNKRIKLKRNSQENNESKAVICKCPECIDKSTVMYTDSCSGGGPERDMGTQKQLPHETKNLKQEWEAKKTRQSDATHVHCECKPTNSVEETTNIEKMDVDRCQTNTESTCCDKVSKVITTKDLIQNTDEKMEMWYPISEWSKQRFECRQKSSKY